jgi:energy-coupling factor transporter ATP-binding protein EcfA2
MSQNEPALGDNPFITQRTRPGALEFLFLSDQTDVASLDELVTRWHAQQRRGAIVGPHGSGKSTLLASLLKHLSQTGTQILHVELHDGQRHLPQAAREQLRHADRDLLLAIDGYEQLSLWQRLRWGLWALRTGVGLIVTSHRGTWLPTLCRVRPALATAQAVVAALQTDRTPAITSQDVAEVFTQQRGDLRETLFALYDLYETRHRT